MQGTNRRTLVFGAVALVSALAGAQAPQGSADPNEQRQQQQAQQGSVPQTDGHPLLMTGVVSQVDRKAKTLTVVTPVAETDVSQWGHTLVVDREKNLVAVEAPLAKDGVVRRDGKSAKLSDLKEGDVVRASFDPSSADFEELNAVSQQQVERDLKAQRKELKQDFKQLQKHPDDQ